MGTDSGREPLVGPMGKIKQAIAPQICTVRYGRLQKKGIRRITRGAMRLGYRRRSRLARSQAARLAAAS